MFNQFKTAYYLLARLTIKSSHLILFSILSNDAIQGFLMPFVNELACGQEERLLSHIEIRIFDHLVRQSDVATEYEQDEDDDVEAEIEQEQGDLVESSKTLDDDGDGDFSIEDADPRAGKGDVTLPQISVDYKNISKILLEAGSKKEVITYSRNFWSALVTTCFAR